MRLTRAFFNDCHSQPGQDAGVLGAGNSLSGVDRAGGKRIVPGSVTIFAELKEFHDRDHPLPHLPPV